MVTLEYIDADRVASLIPYPAPDANKYSRGKTIIVGGDREYPGAAVLAVGGAERCGAGYVEVYCSSEAQRALNIVWPSAVIKSIEDALCCSEIVSDPRAGHPCALLIGSGLAAGTDNDQIVMSIIETCRVPLVIDGGALAMIATEKGRNALYARSVDCDALLTPHYGEALRLASAMGVRDRTLDAASDEDMARLALSLSDVYRATVALKGPKTYIATPDCDRDSVRVMDEGSAALAKAGSGDVLAGMCAAYLSQGLSAYDAASVATYIHALAASFATEKRGIVSVCPEDVVDNISTATMSIGR